MMWKSFSSVHPTWVSPHHWWSDSVRSHENFPIRLSCKLKIATFAVFSPSQKGTTTALSTFGSTHHSLKETGAHIILRFHTGASFISKGTGARSADISEIPVRNGVLQKSSIAWGLQAHLPLSAHLHLSKKILGWTGLGHILARRQLLQPRVSVSTPKTFPDWCPCLPRWRTSVTCVRMSVPPA